MKAITPSPGRSVSSWRGRYNRQGVVYILPALLLFGLMVAYPIGRSLYLSFFDFSFLDPDLAEFVGADNYVKLFEEQANHKPFWNTLYFTVLFTPPYVILGLIVALLLNRLRRGAVFLRTMIFTPVVVSLAVSAVMWTLFYDASFGMAQRMLAGLMAAVNHPGLFAVVLAPLALVLFPLIGVVARRMSLTGKAVAALVTGLVLALGIWVFGDGVWLGERVLAGVCTVIRCAPPAARSLDLVAAPREGVLGNPNWSMPAVVVVCIWNGVGINVILFLVGLQRIPDQLYEAAEVDGATGWQRFWHVTLPQLAPTTYLVILLSMIGSFKIFGQPFIMTRGGPMDSTQTFVMRLYNIAFVYGKFRLGYASALAFALAAFIFVMTLAARKLNRPVD